jgi:hypothetical protein
VGAEGKKDEGEYRGGDKEGGRGEGRDECSARLAFAPPVLSLVDSLLSPSLLCTFLATFVLLPVFSLFTHPDPIPSPSPFHPKNRNKLRECF